jgi:hypothetical protein
MKDITGTGAHDPANDSPAGNTSARDGSAHNTNTGTNGGTAQHFLIPVTQTATGR